MHGGRVKWSIVLITANNSSMPNGYMAVAMLGTVPSLKDNGEHRYCRVQGTTAIGQSIDADFLASWNSRTRISNIKQMQDVFTSDLRFRHLQWQGKPGQAWVLGKETNK